MSRKHQPEESGQILKEVKFVHTVFEGASYEVGRMLGETLKQTGRALKSYDPPEPEQTEKEMRELYQRHCPGLVDEIQGVADCLEVPFQQALFCASVVSPDVQHCSHAAILPSLTANGHTYVARVYDFFLYDSDLHLSTVRAQGNYAHLGFAELLSGRNDGINSRGLSVSMSSSVDRIPQRMKRKGGLHYAFAVRAMLDHCANVNEALDYLHQTPVGSPVTFVIADRSGKAALVENAGKQSAMKRIDASTEEQFIAATNHFTILETQRHHPTSVVRYDALRTFIKDRAPSISKQDLLAYLDEQYPVGICGYIPKMQLGSLWQWVYDLDEGCATIRFGPPPYNQAWQAFTLDEPIGMREFPAVFPVGS